MELRYRPRARTTRDIDLTVSQSPTGGTLATRLDLIRDELQTAASVDLGDYLRFVISPAQTELQGAPDGGARFPCVASLASKVYERFHIDLGFGDAVMGTPEPLVGDDLLAFADIAPAKVLAIPREQQFAEKVHAYTLARGERVNTRTKDLVDLLLLMETQPFDPASLRLAVEETFGRRATHPVPKTSAATAGVLGERVHAHGRRDAAGYGRPQRRIHHATGILGRARQRQRVALISPWRMWRG